MKIVNEEIKSINSKLISKTLQDSGKYVKTNCIYNLILTV
jgi:hypothetical protein